jgi:hypothetical protein
MFQAQAFRPMGGSAFLPQVRLAGFQPSAVRQAAGPIMGYTLEEGRRYYEEAKAAVARFDDLAIRASKIAYKPVRDEIISEYGLLEPGNKDKALYMRGSLQEYVAEVEASTPLNYYVFITDTSRPRNRLNWLQNTDQNFEAAVKDAERTYGSTPEPQVIIKEVPGPAGPTVATDLTVPILIGASAVALALIFG